MQRQKRIAGLLALLLALWSASAWAQFTANRSEGTNSSRAVLNDPTTGTTTSLLAKDTATGALKAAASETDKPLYIVSRGGGTTGWAIFNLSGTVKCTMDSTTSNVAGWWVVASATTAGRCHVLSAAASPPSSGWTVGTMHDNATTAGVEALVASDPKNFTAGSGTGVSSYNVIMPADFITSGCAVSTAGTCTVTRTTQTANVAMRGPASGAAAVPTYRADVPADLPSTLRQSGTTVPTTLPGDVNDYALCGSSGTCSVNGGAADRIISGIAAGVQGDILTIVNGGTTNALKFPNQSSSSSAANRYLMSDDTTLFPGDTLTIRYETTGGINRWKALSNAIPDKYKIRQCTASIGSESSDAPPLADDEDISATCPNKTGKDWKITSITIYAKTGSPTVTPILTGQGGTSLVTGAITGSAGAWVSGTINGTPIVHSFSPPPNAHVCPVAPCTLDLNVTTAGGTVKALTYDVGGFLQ